MTKVRDACLCAIVSGCLTFAGVAGVQAADGDLLPDPWEDDDFARGQPPGENFPGFMVDPGWPSRCPTIG